MVEDFKLAMMKKFEMSDLGLMRYFLGFQVKQSSGEIFISQEKYVEDLLKKFQMLSCKPVPTPMALNEKLQQEDDNEMADEKLYRSLVGSWIYLTNTRPDIVQPVSVLSRFMSKPSKVHYAAAKRVLRFLQGTMKHGLRYVKESNNDLVGFTDSDWAGSLEDRRSTSAYLFCLGSKVISWSSRKQNTVALSSAEAEYSAATSAACEAIWLRRIMADLQQKHTCSTTVFCDNMSAIAMTKNPVFHARS
ncbi:secreted RxLR effector protein 161-like [Zingiber officinale]|uniref:secreted RxLR effector protein 161-like n=1 Tax=Zingiber officinale TaxID=94328 RepID=UPI001C4C4BB2|nr:secreted RxLR effector protein 161-like [Zingiber officinale]